MSGAGWVINGHKAFITAGASADLAMIVAVTDPDAGKRGITTFITPTANPGYKILRKEHKLGHRTNDTAQVVFEDMRVPEHDILGEPGRGLEHRIWRIYRLVASVLRLKLLAVHVPLLKQRVNMPKPVRLLASPSSNIRRLRLC